MANLPQIANLQSLMLSDKGMATTFVSKPYRFSCFFSFQFWQFSWSAQIRVGLSWLFLIRADNWLLKAIIWKYFCTQMYKLAYRHWLFLCYALHHCIEGNRCFGIVTNAVDRSTFAWLPAHGAKKSTTAVSHARTRLGHQAIRMSVCVFHKVRQLLLTFLLSMKYVVQINFADIWR